MIVVAGSVLALTALPTFAGGEAARLVARGIVELNADRNEPALELFTKAVEVDGGSARALYYRGVARGRLGDFEAAAADLSRAVDSDLELPSGELDLGYALLQSGRYADAEQHLRRASENPEQHAEAMLYTAIAQLRDGRPAEADATLKRVAAVDGPQAVATRYYRGLAADRLGDTAGADEHFAYVADRGGDAAVARQARGRLDGRSEAGPKRYLLYGSVGFEYDSNVVLSPDDGAAEALLAISDKSDGRTVLTAGGLYSLVNRNGLSLAVGYELFQSFHFELTDNDLQDHRAQARLTIDRGSVRYGLDARYDYYLRRGDRFLRGATMSPWVTLEQPDFGYTDFYYRGRQRDFIQRRFSALRDGWNHAGGARQSFYLGSSDRVLSVGYRFDREENAHDDIDFDEDGGRFAYDGHQLDVAFALSLPDQLSANAGYAYHYEDYDAGGREDDEHRFAASLSRPVAPGLAVTAAYLGTFNESTDALFDYERHIVSLSLEARY